jgi:hypothetical protein
MEQPVVFFPSVQCISSTLTNPENESDPADRFFVLGGAAVFERVTYFLSRSLEDIQTKHFPGLPPIEFHASPIRTGKGFWRGVPEDKRTELLGDVAEAIATANEPGVVLFAAAIEKSAALHGENAVLQATEQILSRFDRFLKNRDERGLVVFAEGRFDKRAKVWVDQFRQLGTRWSPAKSRRYPIFRKRQGNPAFASCRLRISLRVHALRAPQSIVDPPVYPSL